MHASRQIRYIQECCNHYTPCLKKTANLYFAHCLSNINQFQYKLEVLSRNKPSTKRYRNCPLHLKYVLALPWEIWSVRLSRQRNNKVYIWVINWMATNSNMTGSYCLLKKVTRVTSHHLYYSMCSKCPPPAQMQARRCWSQSPSGRSITVRLRAAHVLLMRRFSLSTSKIVR